MALNIVINLEIELIFIINNLFLVHWSRKKNIELNRKKILILEYSLSFHCFRFLFVAAYWSYHYSTSSTILWENKEKNTSFDDGFWFLKNSIRFCFDTCLLIYLRYVNYGIEGMLIIFQSIYLFRNKTEFFIHIQGGIHVLIKEKESKEDLQ